MTDYRTDQSSPSRSPWRTLEQLADTWGLSRARTRLVVKALVRSGRLEARRRSDGEHAGREFRLLER